MAFDTFSSYLSFHGIVSSSENTIDYQQLYQLGQSESVKEEDKIVMSPFNSEKFRMYAIIPGRGKVPLDKLNDSKGMALGSVFVKFENSKQKKIPLINNGILLRFN